jgi:transcriptional regulator with PAS, ATPase and Fis domain
MESSSKQQLIGSSQALQRVRAEALDAAIVNWGLLLTGETGTGKTTIARFIHDHSSRCDKAFISINCPAIPKELVEATLFGHVRGAFTGAISDKQGAFELANGGTLFLDEVGDLSLEAQAKLLTVIDQKFFTRVGSHKEIKVDVRVIAATHRNLEEMICYGGFREDLYYRLSYLEIKAPSLKERVEDIPELIDYLVQRCAKDLEIETPEIDPELVTWLKEQAYPGNIRDLQRVLSKLILYAATHHLHSIEIGHIKHCMSLTMLNKGGRAGGSQVVVLPDEKLEDVLARIKLAVFETVLAETGYNYSQTAKRLGVHRGNLPKSIEHCRRQIGRRKVPPIVVQIRGYENLDK